MGLSLLPLALVLSLARCSCPPETHQGSDSGVEEDASVTPTDTDGGKPGTKDGGADDGGVLPDVRITQVLPPRGGSGGGTQATIRGSGFLLGVASRPTEAKKVTTLKFGSNPSLDFQIVDDHTIDARVPPGKVGPVEVSLANPRGASHCNGCFTYFDELFIQSVFPREGPLRGGGEVTLVGEGFTPDVEVLFDVRSSPKVTFISSKEIRAGVPRGASAGAVDVTVYNKNGIHTLKRVFRYVDNLRIDSFSPAVSPLAGGVAVTVSGAGFDGTSEVRFGTVAAPFVVASSTSLDVQVPPSAAPGAVDVTVTTPRESRTAKWAFAYVEVGGPFEVFTLFPRLGPSSGGNVVTLLGQGLSHPALTLSVGGVPATVLPGATETAAQFLVPARGISPRVVDVDVTAGLSAKKLTGAYTYRVELSQVVPAVGPSVGGTAVVVSGTNFPGDLEVFFGGLSALLTAAPTETEAQVTSPAGSGGAPSDVWVRSAADPENEAVLSGAFLYEEALSVGRVQPDRAAIAGGTLVYVWGAGFGDGTVVSLGADRCKDLKVEDSHRLTCRTPRAEVGSVDVKVNRLGAADTLPGGFSFFDPRSISGGLSGGPLVGTVNVTVLDGTQGFFGLPVPVADVMLGVDPYTPYQGQTDARGQVTFSDPVLVKPQTVTAWKEGYERTTVTSVNSENLTVFISRTGLDGTPGAPPPGPPPGLISGKVTGFKAPRVLTSNESLEARVFVAQPSLYSGQPFANRGPGPSDKWMVQSEGGDYLIVVRAGLKAVFAVLGVHDKQSGGFEPYLMGIRRGVTVSSDEPALNQDIVLDMHLDLTVPVTIEQPVTIAGAPATNSLYAWIDLGAEGFIPNPNNWSTGTSPQSSVFSIQPTLSLPHFPRLDGSNFIFLNEAAAPTQNGLPVSYFFRRQPGDLSSGLSIGPMLPTPTVTEPGASGFNGTIAWTVEPGTLPDIHNVIVFKVENGNLVTLWSVVQPGAETQVVLPPPVVQSFREEQSGELLYVAILSSRSPKFNYQQWSYDSLSQVNWSSYTIALSPGFRL